MALGNDFLGVDLSLFRFDADIAEAYVPQDLGIDQNFGQVRPGDGKFSTFVGAHRDENGFEPLFHDLIQVGNGGVEPEIDAEVDDLPHLPIHNHRGEAVIGDSHPEHSPGQGESFENGNRISQLTQIPGRGETARPRSDDGNFLLEFVRDGIRGDVGLGVDLVGYEPLQGGNRDRLVDQVSIAGFFATVVADPPADPGERVVLFDHPHRILVTAFADEGDIPLGPLAGGAGVPAGGDAPLFDGIGVGHSLRVELEGRPLLGHAFVEPPHDRHRADLGAIAAAGAFGHVDVARSAADGHPKMTGLSFDLHHVGVGHQGDIEMAPGLH